MFKLKSRSKNTYLRNPIKSSTHQQLSNYRFTDCIGRGNFGDVYKAYDLKQGRNVAIKSINLEMSEDEIPILLQELSLLRSLRHRNITQWYSTFIIDVSMLIVMEYCSEGSCADLLKFNRNGVEECVLSYIMKNTLQGLKYLHEMDIIHRDVKAANILITNKREIKLADFGVSGQMDGMKGKKTFVGTPYWMAPEIIADLRTLRKDRINLERRLIESGLGFRTLYKFWNKKIQENEYNENLEAQTFNEAMKGSQPIDIDNFEEVEYNEKVDIWSLGITLIELGTGKIPNHEKEPLKAIFEIPKSEPPRLPNKASYYLKEFSMACLSKDPTIRPSATELLKFKFITKTRLRSNSLAILSGHEYKLKRRKPKYDLQFETINHGSSVDWNLELTSIKKENLPLSPLESNQNPKLSYYTDSMFSQDSSKEVTSDNIFNISGHNYLKNEQTANTSPLALSPQRKHPTQTDIDVEYVTDLINQVANCSAAQEIATAVRSTGVLNLKELAILPPLSRPFVILIFIKCNNVLLSSSLTPGLHSSLKEMIQRSTIFKNLMYKVSYTDVCERDVSFEVQLLDELYDIPTIEDLFVSAVEQDSINRLRMSTLNRVSISIEISTSNFRDYWGNGSIVQDLNFIMFHNFQMLEFLLPLCFSYVTRNTYGATKPLLPLLIQTCLKSEETRIIEQRALLSGILKSLLCSPTWVQHVNSWHHGKIKRLTGEPSGFTVCWFVPPFP
ncbi:hypothetical protein JL09_g788 [Pichia kudriavzevii]|uniref:non-specific serine/threonine protein kinase n=1 Tax=Pichia kudriavzevii TaxID=4909 RepID=A0A099P740_PICKU|nr:hypothetical protein JL09_g788 [Pichia kudriavzevii]